MRTKNITIKERDKILQIKKVINFKRRVYNIIKL